MLQISSTYRIAAFLMAALCAIQVSGQGETKPLELKWSELAPLIGGQRVSLVLPDGTCLSGEAIAVRDDGLLLDVKKVSGPTKHSKGSASIPRGSVTLITLERMRGSWGRSLGTVVGVLSGVVIAGYVAATTADSAGAGIPLFLGMATGISVAGFYTGREFDKRVTTIKVVP